MSFVSLPFVVLALASLALYWLLRDRLIPQNVVLLVASWVCYGWTNLTWLALLVGLTVVNFTLGLAIERRREMRRVLLVAGITANLGVLFVYKYYDFFVLNVAEVLAALGFRADPTLLGLALPIGISFHVFQLIAYLVDVSRGELAARRDPLAFACFVAYFPQVAAGPIERGARLLVQFEQPRSLSADAVAKGSWLIVLGTFMKVVVADPLGPLVDAGFDHANTNAASLVAGTLAFTAQIYADFCGYSLMAKGISALFGIELVWNFDRPYFATSIQDFWRRWHMSLSQWLRDYVYIPLGGNRAGPLRTEFNLLATMALAGLWHGAAWNFVVWGLLHGGALAVARRASRVGLVQRLPGAATWLLTMTVVVLGWMVFRMESLGALANLDHFAWGAWHSSVVLLALVLAAPVAAVEIAQWRTGDPYVVLGLGGAKSTAVTATLMFGILLFAGQFKVQFIYFQF